MRKASGNIDNVKNCVSRLKGKDITIKYNKGRNRIVYLDGCISEVYNSIFIIKVYNEYYDRLSCSYQDVLCGDIRFNLKNMP